MEFGSNTSRAPMKNKDHSTQQASQEVPAEDGDMECEQSSKKSKVQSKVWHEYEEIKGDALAENKVKCKHYQIVLGANSRHGTSHLKHHLERCPKKVHHDIKQYMLSTDTSGDGSTILTKYKYDEAQIRRLMLTYLVENSRAFDTVEKRGFRKMTKGFNPQFKAFSRHTVRRELLKMYVKERENVKDLILDAPGRVAMTTDNWKNERTNN